MRNYCGACGDLLIDTVEFRYGFCLWCLDERLEKLDAALADLWYDEDA